MGETCETCRWWNKPDSWKENGTCERLHAGGGDRPWPRIFPVTSGAYLETPEDFGCSLHEHTPRGADDADAG